MESSQPHSSEFFIAPSVANFNHWRVLHPIHLAMLYYRIALAKKESLQRSMSQKERGSGIWGMVKSLTTSASNESILLATVQQLGAVMYTQHVHSLI